MPDAEQNGTRDRQRTHGSDHHRSIGARIGRLALAGLTATASGVAMLIFSTAIGIALVVVGLLMVVLAPTLVLSRVVPAKPRPGFGERPPVRYGPSIVGTIIRAIDPKHGEQDNV